jgi:hypothetical protein
VTAAGLFPEPERVELPAGPWAMAPGGWSYGFFGEDGENLVIAGWADRAAVAEVFRAAGIQFDPKDYAPLHVWARELLACPDHSVKDGDCSWCTGIEPGEPWLDWSAPPDDPDAHRDKPGYVRMSVIDLEG